MNKDFIWGGLCLIGVVLILLGLFLDPFDLKNNEREYSGVVMTQYGGVSTAYPEAYEGEPIYNWVEECQ